MAESTTTKKTGSTKGAAKTTRQQNAEKGFTASTTLANNLQAVITNAPDKPGYASADTLFPFGHGLSY